MCHGEVRDPSKNKEKILTQRSDFRENRWKRKKEDLADQTCEDGFEARYKDLEQEVKDAEPVKKTEDSSKKTAAAEVAAAAGGTAEAKKKAEAAVATTAAQMTEAAKEEASEVVAAADGDAITKEERKQR